MSGIFGIYHPDDRPINSAHLQKMAMSIAHRGPDGTKVVQQDHIGFGHSMLQTTIESLNEQLPFTDTESQLTITADARIDNREELAEKLALHNIADVPDSQLILLAFRKWGCESFQQLIGDFSFAIWDPHNQQLICARDYIGIKPFYYHHSPEQFLFSSEIKQLADHPDVPLNVNEAMVGEYLSFSFCSKTETLFTDITRLAPGHFLIVRPDKISIRKYWSWEPKQHLCYKTTREYTEHFLEIFEQAVKNRLRCDGAISAELSGGLDSSTVVGMANKLLSQNDKQLQTYSMLFPGLTCDEKTYIDAVSKHNNIPVNYIPYNNYIFLSWREQVRQTFEPPDYPNLSMSNPLLSAIQKSSSRVILSGIGGDECFTGSGYPYLDFLKGKKFLDLINEFRYRCNQKTLPALKRLSINISWPFTPPIIRNILSKRAAKRHVPKWLSENFTNKIQLTKRIHKADPRRFLSNLGGVSHAGIFAGGGEQFFLEQLDRQRAFWKTENRYPFLDQRIVKFSMSIPDYEKQQQGQIKHLLRNQYNQLLPGLVKERKSKAEFSYLFNQAFQHSLFLLDIQKLSLTEMDWIDKSILNDTITSKRKAITLNKYASGHKVWELWFVFSINLWYKEISAYNKKRGI